MTNSTRWPFKAASKQIIRCAANGIYFADYSLRSVSITNEKANAMTFAKTEDIEVAIEYMRAVYGAFDWQAVPA